MCLVVDMQTGREVAHSIIYTCSVVVSDISHLGYNLWQGGPVGSAYPFKVPFLGK